MLLLANPANDIPWWVTLLAGIGVGTMASAVIGLIGGWRQRAHDIKLARMQKFQATHDARLDRLRDDLREAMLVVNDLQKAAHQLDLVTPVGGSVARWERLREGVSSLDTARSRYNAVRARLILDPLGHRLMDSIAELTNDVSKLSGLVYEFYTLESMGVEADRHASIRSIVDLRDRILGTGIVQVVDIARRLLHEAEREPLAMEQPGSSAPEIPAASVGFVIESARTEHFQLLERLEQAKPPDPAASATALFSWVPVDNKETDPPAPE